MTRKNDKRVYTIKEIKPIDDCSKFNMAFPILFPNTDYFQDLNSILNSYGIVLKNLSDVNYDIEEYFKNIKENPILNCIVKSSNFKVSNVKDTEDFEEDNEYIDMVVSSENNELVFGVKYNSNKFILEDFEEETSYDISLVLELDCLFFYFTGSYCFILDKKENIGGGKCGEDMNGNDIEKSENGKMFFVYLD